MNSKDHSLNFQCSDCGKQYPKWQGQCFTCNKWDTIIENISNQKTFLDIGGLEINDTSLIDLSEVSSSDIDKDTYKIETKTGPNSTRLVFIDDKPVSQITLGKLIKIIWLTP